MVLPCLLSVRIETISDFPPRSFFTFAFSVCSSQVCLIQQRSRFFKVYVFLNLPRPHIQREICIIKSRCVHKHSHPGTISLVSSDRKCSNCHGSAADAHALACAGRRVLKPMWYSTSFCGTVAVARTSSVCCEQFVRIRLAVDGLQCQPLLHTGRVSTQSSSV